MASPTKHGSATDVAQTHIERIEPPQGPAAGGYPVRIHGRALADVVDVQFGHASAQAIEATKTVVTCRVPEGSVGEVDVYCVDKRGKRSNRLRFRYTPAVNR